MTKQTVHTTATTAYGVAQQAELASVLGFEGAEMTSAEVSRLYFEGVDDGLRLAANLLEACASILPADLAAPLLAAVAQFDATDAQAVRELLAEFKDAA